MHSRLAAVVPVLLALIAGARAQNNTSIHTTWLWHLHQPIYWPENHASSDHYENAWDTIQAQDGGRPHPVEVVRNVFNLDDRIAAYQSRPKDAINSIAGNGSGQQNLPRAGVQLNYSGALMENVQSLAAANQLGYGSTWYQPDRDGKAWKIFGNNAIPHMDVTNFTYHHALPALLSDETLEMEIRLHMRQSQIFFGDPPSRGFFPAETAFSERIIPILKKLGINWSVVANNHLSRACSDFPVVIGSGGENCDLPNKADQINPAQTNYKRITIDRGVSPAAAIPFAFQLHYARYVDPNTGAESKIVVVPADQALGWKDSYSTWDLGLLDSLHNVNNPAKPALVLPAHDGDNAWSGGYSYYMEWVPNFTSQAVSRGYEPTTVEQFLAEYPPDANDVVHVEDGGWEYADGDFGSPIYVNWHFPPSHNDASTNNVNVVDPSVGVSDKADVWRVIVATENRVKTAQQITGITPNIDQVRDPGSFSTTPNNVELAWHYYLGGLDSGFVYYGVHDDEGWRPVIAQNNAQREIGGVLNDLTNDHTPPTVFIPQRHPWNPGAKNYGVQYGYIQTTPANTDFWIWTYAYDASGVQNVSLKFRSNGANHPPTQDEFKTYAGGLDTGAWQTQAMTKRVVAPVDGVQAYGNAPQFVADYYYSKVTGLSDTYVDYYVTATDTKGNTYNSPIQHVYVAPGTTSSPTPTPSPTPSATPTPTATPAPTATPVPFTMDGAADSAGYLVANNGMTIYAALRGTLLYVATWSPGNNSGGTNDHFIFVSDQLLASATTAAPWGKAGSIGIAGSKPFLAGESMNNYAGWTNAPFTATAAKAATNSGQLEGVIDLVAAFGTMPQTIYIASAAYETHDASNGTNNGVLAAQCPAGNGDGNIDPNEFLVVQIPAVLDRNADGKFDRLDPAMDFTSTVTPSGNDLRLTWNSVPSKSYQVLWSSSPNGAWENATNGLLTAGPLQLTLTYTDLGALSNGARFYRVELQ